MRIRHALPSDIPQIAKIGANAFEAEPIYERFYPLRHLYRQDYYQGFVDEAYKFLITPGHRMVVAEIELGGENGDAGASSSGAKPATKVVGYATFIGHGSAPKLKTWNPDTMGKRIRRFFFNIRNIWTSFFSPNRAVYWPAIKEYYRQAGEVQKLNLPSPTSSRIDFKTLAVDPDYQGQKIGERLVEWCGMTAWKAAVPVFGDATTKGLPLYLKSGCKDIGRIHLPKQVVPTGGRGSPIELDPLEIVVLKWETQTDPLEGRARK